MPTTVTVLDSTGTTQTVNTLPALGQGLKAASLPVALASDQGALTVSGTVTANAGTGTFAVSGTFWQATQPVSGTFWQATQPVSLAALPALIAGSAIVGKVGIDQTTVGTTNGVALAQIGANTILTGNGVTGTGSQRVTIASDQTAFSVNAVQSGTWNVTNLSQFGGVAINLGAGVVSTGTLRITQASDSPLVAVTGATTDAAVGNGTAGTLAGYLRSIKDAATDTTTPSPVSAPTLTKGTQGANGFSVQDLKDSGRTSVCLTAEFAFAQTAETLLTMTKSANGAATTTGSSLTITSGKKFRIQAMHMIAESLGSGTTPQRAYLRLRVNTAGATTTSSPLQAILSCGVTTAIVKATEKVDMSFPEGLEFNGDGTATFGLSLETPDWVTTTATGRAKITVIGYEY